jgi:hypothetical protein
MFLDVSIQLTGTDTGSRRVFECSLLSYIRYVTLCTICVAIDVHRYVRTMLTYKNDS